MSRHSSRPRSPENRQGRQQGAVLRTLQLRAPPQGPGRPWPGQAPVRYDHQPAQARAIRVKTGTLVDATIIASASEDDGEARWVKHKGKPAVHGFKAHVGADADTALVEEIAVTPANINDGKAGPNALPDAPARSSLRIPIEAGGVFRSEAGRAFRFEAGM